MHRCEKPVSCTVPKLHSQTEELIEDKSLGTAGLAKRTNWVEAIFFSVVSSSEQTCMVTMAQ